MAMEMRHTKVDVFNEVVQKGGRCQSSTASQKRASSALPEPEVLTHSNSSFKSIRSAHFQEVELSEAVVEHEIEMKQKIYPNDEDHTYDGCYVNKALELDEESDFKRVQTSKHSVSSALSSGLVMEGSRAQRKRDGHDLTPHYHITEVPSEAKKYAITDRETTAIIVKEASCAVSDNLSGNVPADDTNLKRSSTIDSGSVPSTSYTYDSLHQPSTSYDIGSIKDETLLIDDDNRELGSSTLSQTSSNNTTTPKEFETPPGMTDKSLQTYQRIQKNGVKSGRCILTTMVVLTFVITMVLAVLLLLMPDTAKKEDKGTFSSTEMSPTSPSFIKRFISRDPAVNLLREIGEQIPYVEPNTRIRTNHTVN